MTNILIELFHPKYGGVHSYVLIIAITILILTIILVSILGSERDIEKQNERNMIESMECNKLGELILNQKIQYYNEDFALDHWIIRCK